MWCDHSNTRDTYTLHMVPIDTTQTRALLLCSSPDRVRCRKTLSCETFRLRGGPARIRHSDTSRRLLPSAASSLHYHLSLLYYSRQHLLNIPPAILPLE